MGMVHVMYARHDRPIYACNIIIHVHNDLMEFYSFIEL